MTPYYLVIPARYGSSRLQGKPLLEIGGRPLILHVLDNARASSARAVYVATDDERIALVVERDGGQVRLTRPEHPSGTDRVAEVVEDLGLGDEAVVVNLQGDEPMVPPSLLDDLASRLTEDTVASLATIATPIRATSELFDPNVVKVVLNDRGQALYFSRAPIPFCRDRFEMGTTAAALPAATPFLRHLGLYAYRVGALRAFVSAPPAALEEAEKLEQLRALALGMAISVHIVETPPGHGIDTPADLERYRRAHSAS